MADLRRDIENRPSPEALLEAARREERRVGKLRIFVGAAPGVGKTYEMLLQAQARRKDGYDVVIGIVESHGRKETEALLSGLEVIPRRRVEYKGQSLTEMDLDAIIARHPQIVLVDELAHTNAEGSRHPKRYLDVEELMSHGIDVYTTVNIQPIESLNDVVAQINHFRVRETVPDAGRGGARAFLPAGQSHRIARARLAPHRRARRRPIAQRDAGARHPGAVGGRRAHCRVRQRRSALCRPRAL